MLKNNKKKIILFSVLIIVLVLLLIFIFNSFSAKENKDSYQYYDSINIQNASLDKNPTLWDFNHSSIGWHSVDSANHIGEKYTGYMAILFDDNFDNYLIDKYIVKDFNNLPLIGLGINSGNINQEDKGYLDNFIKSYQASQKETYNDKDYYLYIIPIGENDNEYNVKNNTVNNLINFSYNNNNNNSFMSTYVAQAGWPTDWLRKNYEIWGLDFINNSLYDQVRYKETIIIPSKKFYNDTDILEYKDIDIKNNGDKYIIYNVSEEGIMTQSGVEDSLEWIDYTIPKDFVDFKTALEFTNKVYYQKFKI